MFNQKKPEHWITKNGVHIPIYNDVLQLDGKRHDIETSGGRARYSIQKIGADKQIIYVHGIEVEKSKRNKGIGKSLLHRLQKLSDDNGIDIVLEAVPIRDSSMTEEQLINWYKKQGFQQKFGNELHYKAKKTK